MPWDKCEQLCANTKIAVSEDFKSRGINHFLICCRVTQTYDAGACVYFYFGFPYTNQEDPMHIYEEVEIKAREAILASGGISFVAECSKFHFRYSQVVPYRIIMVSEKLEQNGTSKVCPMSASSFLNQQNSNWIRRIFSQREIFLYLKMKSTFKRQCLNCKEFFKTSLYN